MMTSEGEVAEAKRLSDGEKGLVANDVINENGVVSSEDISDECWFRIGILVSEKSRVFVGNKIADVLKISEDLSAVADRMELDKIGKSCMICTNVSLDFIPLSPS